jgi:prepilin-type N-terminal cleavage/methylation domain-containing protein
MGIRLECKRSSAGGFPPKGNCTARTIPPTWGRTTYRALVGVSLQWRPWPDESLRVLVQRRGLDVSPRPANQRAKQLRQVMEFNTASIEPRRQSGFTLVEVLVSLGIVTLLFSGILTAYIQSSRQAEWAGYSLAAQAIGIQQLDQARSGIWDDSINKNELTNLNLFSWSYNATTRVGTGYTTNVLDVPISGTNIVIATNFVTVKLLSLTGLTNMQIQMVTVDTVWSFLTSTGRRLFTNRTASYFGPDNRDASSL